ncbi:MAG: glycoside hydrolase family 3 C-terminal domain-containing protein [Ignavibacteriales bacterium]|nr:glycoside hydrolase family 3 C-terminal domain-containing protein [Ignavibacteriales bacterium]
MHLLLRKTIIGLILFLVLSSAINSQSKSFETKIDSIIAVMTLEEKVGQLNQLSSGLGWGPVVKQEDMDAQKKLVKEGKVGSFLNAVGADITRQLQKVAIEETRLKIPLIFGLDVIHGFKTTFPVPLAEASSWDPSAVEKSARYSAKEASASGIHWTFGPMVDIARDPRWGRIVEGSGEDTYLGSVMAAARVKGFQGNLTSNENIIACAKHFAAYGAAEGGRDYNTVDISERTLREVYLPPFKAAVDAGVKTFMCSFNEIAGVPSSANHHLLTEILRGEWKFKGFVVSDWNSVGELIPHQIAANPKEAALLGLNAGVDMDMEARAYIDQLPELIKQKKISEEMLNESVRRILRVKFELGLFDNPYRNCNAELEKTNILTKENKEAALDVARKSIVLLKNENNLLPLNKTLKTIAVIGPLADSQQDPLGSWEQLGDPKNVVTLLQGIKTKVPTANILYSKGCNILGNSKKYFDEAIETAKKSDVIILALGEEGHMTGEARSRASLDLPGVQEDLAKEIFKTGKPVIVILMNGRPLSINWIAANIPTVVETWFLGLQAGNAIADVLFGDYNPGGKLTVTFPRTVGQVPIYYNHKNTGRPYDPKNFYTSYYIDTLNTPLYPFGFGLSFTKFEYGKVKLSADKILTDGKLKVSVDVKNSGEYDGEEVVQLYVKDDFASVTRPVKELKGFKKIFLKKGESQTVNFELGKNDLAFYNKDMKWTVEPGTFKVFVGTNSVDVQESSFEVVE